MSFEHCYQLHTPRESWNHRNMAGHRVFRCHHTDAPWNSTHTRIFSVFLASIFEIGKWNLRLPVQHVSGGHNHSKLWHMRVWGHFGAHHRAYSPIVVLTWPMKWFRIALGCGTCPCHPKLAYATTEMWPPDTRARWTPNLEIHFLISNIDARKKLNTWAHVEPQGASVNWPRILLNVNIWQRKIRYPAISLWFQLSWNMCVW